MEKGATPNVCTRVQGGKGGGQAKLKPLHPPPLTIGTSGING